MEESSSLEEQSDDEIEELISLMLSGLGDMVDLDVLSEEIKPEIPD